MESAARGWLHQDEAKTNFEPGHEFWNTRLARRAAEEGVASQASSAPLGRQDRGGTT